MAGMFGVNEIMAAVADAIVGVNLYSLLSAVVTTVMIVFGVALIALGIYSRNSEGLGFIAMGGAVLTIAILGALFEGWYASNPSGVLHLSRFLLSSPWTYIVGGVVGVVFYLILVAYSHSPNVEIGPISALIGFVVCFALITFGILGLFDFRYVRVARTIAVGVPKITETISVFAGLIFLSTLFIVFLSSTLTEDRDVGCGCIVTLILGAMLVYTLLAVLPHYFPLNLP